METLRNNGMSNMGSVLDAFKDDINALDKKGRKLIDIYLMMEEIDMRALEQLKNQIPHVDRAGSTTLVYALGNKTCTFEIIKFLLDHGADPKITKEASILIKYLREPSFDLKIVDLLISKGIQINCQKHLVAAVSNHSCTVSTMQ